MVTLNSEKDQRRLLLLSVNELEDFVRVRLY